MRILIPALCLVSVLGCAEPTVPDDAPADPGQQEKISLGNPKLTDKIGKFDPDEGRNVSDSKGTYSNPITGPLEMYGPMLERISKLKIEHAVRLYHAEHGEYPQNYDEFMTRIVKANRIKLPVLPGGLEYQYDEQNHKLVVVEKKQAN